MSIKLIEEFFAIVNQFSPFHDGQDLYWIFFIQVKRSWIQIEVRKYKDEYFVSSSSSISFSFPTEILNPKIESELYPKNLKNRFLDLSESSLESTTAGFASWSVLMQYGPTCDRAIATHNRAR